MGPADIVNPRTGQQMTFLTHRPDLLEIDTVNPPSDVREPEHVHPQQESGARVVSGQLTFDVAGEQRTLGPGDDITIPPNVRHHFWNPGSEDARAIQFFSPALKTREFFETLFALARDDKLDAKGMPSPLQLAVMVPYFSDEIRPTRPPWPVLRVLAAGLRPVARARGHRPVARYERPGTPRSA
jgi:mannose-6-phosphate isomerase-like protein (cupin superfamily)